LRSADRSIAPSLDVPLAPLTTLGVGGPAQWFVRATTIAEAKAALKWGHDSGASVFVIGGGSNLVIADGGISGLVLQIAIRGVELHSKGRTTTLRVGAGESWDAVVEAAVSRGLAGVECLSGIPGTTGGTPIQNVGAYGQDVAASIVAVTVLDRTSGEMAVLTAADCRFGYRTSRFKREDAGRFLVCEVTFALGSGPPTVAYPDVVSELTRTGISTPTLNDVRNAVLSVRRRKGMVLDPADSDTRSVGSFFMNPVVDADRGAQLASMVGGRVPMFELPGGKIKIPAAWLIEQSGFARGHSVGATGLSSKHPLAIVNRGGATAGDVLTLAARIKRRVADRFGIRLRAEPAFLGFENNPDVAFLEETDT
jgi:UDP-N-acetylmuramate dehydrogenase